MSSPWRTNGTRIVYENAWIRVREDAVTHPNGGEGIYGVVEVCHPAVFVVPVTDDDEVVLVELFRYTIGRLSLEIPAGGSDGEDLLVAAQRELREETGLVAAKWEQLGEMFGLNGVCEARNHVFLARGVRPADDEIDHVEEGIIAVHRLRWPEVLDLVRTGGITDSETVAALLHAAIALRRVS